MVSANNLFTAKCVIVGDGAVGKVKFIIKDIVHLLTHI